MRAFNLSCIGETMAFFSESEMSEVTASQLPTFARFLIESARFELRVVYSQLIDDITGNLRAELTLPDCCAGFSFPIFAE